MRATFRQLRLFLAVAEHLSITAAARACHVTQPTVSMQIKELSDAIGLPLYEQIGKRLYLTEAGEALVTTARTMVEEWNTFEQRVDAMKGLTRGRLSVAVVSTAEYFVPRLLGTFFAAHPDIDIALEVLNRDRVIARLRENRDDLYIMSVPPDDMELERHAFLPNPLHVIAPHDHPLAGRKAIPISELQSIRFIMREKGSGTRFACDQHFERRGFRPHVRLELGSNEAIKHAVVAGMGLSVLSQHALNASPAAEQLAILDVEGFPILSNWWTLYPAGKRLSPVAAVFLDHVERNSQEWRTKQLNPAP